MTNLPSCAFFDSVVNITETLCFRFMTFRNKQNKLATKKDIPTLMGNHLSNKALQSQS